MCKSLLVIVLLILNIIINTNKACSQCGEGTHVHLINLSLEYSSWGLDTPYLRSDHVSVYAFDGSDFHSTWAAVASLWGSIDEDCDLGRLSCVSVTENGSNGYRCPVQNHLAGGALYSKHQFGKAADMICDANQYETYFIQRYGGDTYKVSSTCMHLGVN
jgi:hypothetical protein